MNTDLFEIGNDLQRGEEEELIAQGLRICSKCPVRKPCRASATDLDKYWTTRGGQPPEGLFEDSVVPIPRSPQRKARKPKETCKHGHSEWSVDANGIRRCIPCRKESDRKGQIKKVARKKEKARLAELEAG